MRAVELDYFGKTNYLCDGSPDVLDNLRPIFDQLIDRLRLLPEGCGEAELLVPFAETLTAINKMGDEIETEERETILCAIYDIGQIVGLDPNSQFAETWRGDW